MSRSLHPLDLGDLELMSPETHLKAKKRDHELQHDQHRPLASPA